MKAKSPKPAAQTSNKQTKVSGHKFTPPSYGVNFVDGQSISNDAPVQGMFEASSAEASSVNRTDKSAASSSDSLPNKTGLPDNLKSGIENLSGFSMDDVKVHYNSSRPAQLNALAYAQGTEIHLAPGQEKHLPHEAWHVVQQKQGRVKPTLQMKGGININDSVSLEKEADVMGEKAIQLKSFGLSTRSQNKTNNFISTKTVQRLIVVNPRSQPYNENEIIKEIYYSRDGSAGGNHFIPDNWINSLVIHIINGLSLKNSIIMISHLTNDILTYGLIPASLDTKYNYEAYLDSCISQISNSKQNLFAGKGSGDNHGESIDVPVDLDDQRRVAPFGKRFVIGINNAYQKSKVKKSSGVTNFLKTITDFTKNY